jgi:prepilin-type N-terminal cleavage/methylation domain-containing protein
MAKRTRARRARFQRAFTLLEVVLAVAIIGLIAFSIYRFVELNLTAIRVSREQSKEQAAMQAFIAVLQAQLNDLPPARSGALRGDAHKFANKPSDEMLWVCTAGNGLFTQFADGEYDVTLMLKPIPKSTTSELGLRRLRSDGSDTNPHWLHLLGDVDAMEIRYYDQRLNAWLERWTDLQARPSLVRIRIWRAGAGAPYEAILSLPLAGLPT